MPKRKRSNDELMEELMRLRDEEIDDEPDGEVIEDEETQIILSGPGVKSLLEMLQDKHSGDSSKSAAKKDAKETDEDAPDDANPDGSSDIAPDPKPHKKSLYWRS